MVWTCLQQVRENLFGRLIWPLQAFMNAFSMLQQVAHAHMLNRCSPPAPQTQRVLLNMPERLQYNASAVRSALFFASPSFTTCKLPLV